MQNFSLIATIAAGLFAGAIHVVTGPDHLAAVAPLAFGQKSRTWLLGVRWGAGHATGVILVAVLAWLARELVPVELFSSHCERLVGVMLIGIGLWGLQKAMRSQLHTHQHAHDGKNHVHVHAHGAVSHHERRAHLHTHAALAVGVLHGLAGASHFLGVLPALAMPTRGAAGIYLVSFGLGTIAAMACFSFLIGSLGQRIFSPVRFKAMMVTLSGAAIVVGAVWIAM